jgi:hypothetical protein
MSNMEQPLVQIPKIQILLVLDVLSWESSQFCWNYFVAPWGHVSRGREPILTSEFGFSSIRRITGHRWIP